MLKALIKFFKALNRNSHPGEIAHAVCLGMLLGFMPKTNAMWYIITVFCLFIRINKGSFVLFTALFSLLAPVVDPLLDSIGWWFLHLEHVAPAIDFLINIPFVGFTRINNTMVAGALVASLVLYMPVYVLARLIIGLMRTKLIPLIRKTKFILILSKIPLVQKIADLSGNF